MTPDLSAIRRAIDPDAATNGDIRCPVHADKHASLSVHISDAGRLVARCHAGCEQDFVFAEIKRRAGHLLNGDARGNGDKRETVYTYLNAEGNPIARVHRVDNADGSKKFSQATPDGNGGWQWKGPKGKTPLYRLDALAKHTDATVVVCEGEKACEAAQRLLGDRFVATSWMGGAGAVERADFQPLQGRDVVVWPDADEPGAKAAAAVVTRLKGIARQVHLVRVDDLPPKSDAADVKWTADDLIARLIEQREPVTPERDAPDLLAHSFWVRDAVVNTALPYVVKGVFGKGHIVVFWGAPGSGKTFVSMGLSCSVGVGLPWYGRRTRRGVVIYVAAESSRPYIENRIAALRSQAPALADAEVLIVPLALDLLHTDRGDVDRVIATAKRIAEDRSEVVLVVIDTLAVTFGGGNENAPDDMGLYVRNVQRIRSETGAAVLIVHHCGKDEARGMRGHSALLGAIDAELTIEGANDSDRILRTGKVRDGDGYTDLFSFRLLPVELGVDADGDPVRSCVVDAADQAGTEQARRKRDIKGLGRNQKLVLTVLEAGGGRMTRVDLARKVKDEGLSRQRFNEALAALLESGMLIAHNLAPLPAEVSLA